MKNPESDRIVENAVHTAIENSEIILPSAEGDDSQALVPLETELLISYTLQRYYEALLGEDALTDEEKHAILDRVVPTLNELHTQCERLHIPDDKLDASLQAIEEEAKELGARLARFGPKSLKDAVHAAIENNEISLPSVQLNITDQQSAVITPLETEFLASFCHETLEPKDGGAASDRERDVILARVGNARNALKTQYKKLLKMSESEALECISAIEILSLKLTEDRVLIPPAQPAPTDVLARIKDSNPTITDPQGTPERLLNTDETRLLEQYVLAQIYRDNNTVPSLLLPPVERMALETKIMSQHPQAPEEHLRKIEQLARSFVIENYPDSAHIDSVILPPQGAAHLNSPSVSSASVENTSVLEDRFRGMCDTIYDRISIVVQTAIDEHKILLPLQAPNSSPRDDQSAFIDTVKRLLIADVFSQLTGGIGPNAPVREEAFRTFYKHPPQSPAKTLGLGDLENGLARQHEMNKNLGYIHAAAKQCTSILRVETMFSRYLRQAFDEQLQMLSGQIKNDFPQTSPNSPLFSCRYLKEKPALFTQMYQLETSLIEENAIAMLFGANNNIIHPQDGTPKHKTQALGFALKKEIEQCLHKPIDVTGQFARLEHSARNFIAYHYPECFPETTHLSQLLAKNSKANRHGSSRDWLLR